MAKEAGVKIISCMGTGNKIHPEMLEVSDIKKTQACPLARVMRRELKKRGIEHLKVVYSKEKVLSTAASEDETELKSGHPAPASCAFVPATAGLLIAKEVLCDLTGICQ